MFYNSNNYILIFQRIYIISYHLLRGKWNVLEIHETWNFEIPYKISDDFSKKILF